MENYVSKAKQLIEFHDRDIGINNDSNETMTSFSAFNEIQQTDKHNQSVASQQKRKRSTSDVMLINTLESNQEYLNFYLN